MSDLGEEIYRAICDVTQASTAGLHEPYFDDEEERFVLDCIRSSFVSSVGKYVSDFEEELASYLGVRRAVAVVNGTSALQIALQLAGVGPGDEVLIPTLSFVATANAVRYCGATPHFIDSCVETLGLDVNSLEARLATIGVVTHQGCQNKETGATIRAVVPMHTFGHPCDMEKILRIAEKYSIRVVEDAAESLGSTYQGIHTGSFGLVSAISFNGNKIITTGGGGAIVTNNEELGNLAKHLTTTARIPQRWGFLHDQVGYNYRMPNINAALGCAQMKKLPLFVEAKRQLAFDYASRFKSVPGISFKQENDGCSCNYWLQTVLLDDDRVCERDSILTYLNDRRITARPAWSLLHTLPMYTDCPKTNLSTSVSLEKRIINIPSSPFLSRSFDKNKRNF